MHYGVVIKNLMNVNRIVRFLALGDLLLWGGWGFIGPVFALFIVAQIEGASAATVGIAAGIYWIVKALVQIPVASYLDHTPGEKDDFYALIFSFILAGFVAMSFLLVQSASMLFFITALQGVAFGIYTPSWAALFSRHLDSDHNALDWALDSTTVGLAYGSTGIIGGILAATFGFSAVFVLASILCFGGVVLLVTVPNFVIPRPEKSGLAKPEEAPPLIRK
jgi:MFS family permease